MGPPYSTVRVSCGHTALPRAELTPGNTILSRDREEARQCGGWGGKGWVLPGLLLNWSLYSVGQAISNGFQFSFLVAKYRC